MNLLKADFFRLFKNKAFYILLGVTFAMPILTCIMFPTMTVEKIIFQGLDTTLFCTICGIMIALFVGKDYDNNTIRNKICYGEKRMKIMGVSFVETLLITIMFVAASVYTSYMQGGSSATFNGMYLNSIIVAVAYAVIAVGITSFVAKRQSYK